MIAARWVRAAGKGVVVLTTFVIYGDNPEQGLFRGSTLLHPPLRFRLDFPSQWTTANSARQVMAQAPKGVAVASMEQAVVAG